MKRNSKFIFVLSALLIAGGNGISYTPVYTGNHSHNHNHITRLESSSSSGSSSSSSGSGVYGDDTSSYDANKIQSIGSRLEKYVKPGDIFVDTVGAIIKIGFIKYETGHAGIVKSVSYRDGKCFIKTIEALGPGEGIQEVELTAQRVYKGYIYRVPNLTDKQINDSIYFAEKQVGKEYKFKLLKSQRATSINTDSWYCSELVVASFLYGANIDLASNDTSGWINPTAIGENSNTKKVVDNTKETTATQAGNNHVITCDGDTITEGHCLDKDVHLCRICGKSC
ncbi:MAG: hypothetical protein HUJ61_05670 [Bacilli bacterium]|nr:hypothetical protein [Bacilli bacterium]